MRGRSRKGESAVARDEGGGMVLELNGAMMHNGGIAQQALRGWGSANNATTLDLLKEFFSFYTELPWKKRPRISIREKWADGGGRTVKAKAGEVWIEDCFDRWNNLAATFQTRRGPAGRVKVITEIKMADTHLSEGYGFAQLIKLKRSEDGELIMRPEDFEDKEEGQKKKKQKNNMTTREKRTKKRAEAWQKKEAKLAKDPMGDLAYKTPQAP
ncbi:hypothetical protein T484DRAFT_1876617 [Baffinella frigidus]|nr:hypothetical protein T484DRAFT_1876617 [Cryptophyta sp. CCMP2293]